MLAAVTPRKAGEMSGMSGSTIRRLCNDAKMISRMANDGLLAKDGYGKYMSEVSELSDSD